MNKRENQKGAGSIGLINLKNKETDGRTYVMFSLAHLVVGRG